MNSNAPASILTERMKTMSALYWLSDVVAFHLIHYNYAKFIEMHSKSKQFQKNYVVKVYHKFYSKTSSCEKLKNCIEFTRLWLVGREERTQRRNVFLLRFPKLSRVNFATCSLDKCKNFSLAHTNHCLPPNHYKRPLSTISNSQ